MFQVIRSKYKLKKVIEQLKITHQSIGLVPTMGALHQGHFSLVQLSKKKYNVTIATIFVNPAQFNNKEDLLRYPNEEISDIAMLKDIGCDFIFIPKINDIYEHKTTVQLSFGYLETILEGKHRPGHFNGVGLIVTKLLNLIRPTGVYFGQKDLHQFKIISTLVNDFDLGVKLHLAPIIREKSGLAMSSRNKQLSDINKQKATVIYRTLLLAQQQLSNGVECKTVVKNAIYALEGQEGVRLEYFEIVDAETLQKIMSFNKGDRLALCIAAYVANIRLIDNIIIKI